MAALKIFVRPSDISVILVLASVDYHFLIQFEIFLVLGMICDFLWKPGHCEC